MENEFDFAQMMQMAEMMKLFSGFNDTQKDAQAAMEPSPEKENVKTEPIKSKPVFFDDTINTTEMKTIKAAIPHLEYKYQKTMAIFVKLVEISKLLEMYSISAAQLNQEQNKNWRREMLKSIRPHVEGEKRQKIEMLIKCIDIKEIMTTMEGMK